MKLKFCLIVFIIFSIILTACTPKKTAEEAAQEYSQEYPQNEKTAETSDTANSANESELAGDFYFSLTLTDNSTPFNIREADKTGECFHLQAFKTVFDIRVISIGLGDDGQLFHDSDLLSIDNNVFVIRVNVSETVPTRGISFMNEHGGRTYQYFGYDGRDGKYKLHDFTPLFFTAVCYEEFYDETIPIYIQYTHSDVESSHKKAIFEYNGMTHIIPLAGIILPFDSEGADFGISVKDYNFDRILDINFVIGGQYSSEYYVFIFNQRTKKYVLSEELSGSGYNYRVEPDYEKEITRQRLTIPNPINNKVVFELNEYKWEGENPKLVRSEKVKVIEAYEKYTMTTRTLQDNGSWTESTENVEPSPDYYGW